MTNEIKQLSSPHELDCFQATGPNLVVCLSLTTLLIDAREAIKRVSWIHLFTVARSVAPLCIGRSCAVYEFWQIRPRTNPYVKHVRGGTQRKQNASWRLGRRAIWSQVAATSCRPRSRAASA